MNKYRRNQINEIIKTLTTSRDELEALKDEDQEAFDNYPENLQYSERGEMMQEAIDTMEEALSNVEEAIDTLLCII